MANAALLLLADSRFPTGAHAHSSGVEAAHARGDLQTLEDLVVFLDGRLATVGVTESAFAAAACAPDAQWAVLDRELAARTPSPRLRGVSRSLGRQLLRAAERAWPVLATRDLRSIHRDGPMQPVALGATAAAAGLAPVDAALCSLHHLVGAVTTAAVRLLGLDPFDVQAVAAGHATMLEQMADEAVHRALSSPRQLPANNSLLSDILAEHHATWEVRLFAS